MTALGGCGGATEGSHGGPLAERSEPAPGSEAAAETDLHGGLGNAGGFGRAGGLGDGFVVWESNRTGDWRIWTAHLDATGQRQLSADEPGMEHCCPHVSPDGTRVAYLSRRVPKDRYPETEVAGELRLIDLGARAPGNGPLGETAGLPASGRVIASSARTYGWGDRAVVWRTDDELIYVGGDGRTYLLSLPNVRKGDESPAARALTTAPREELGWLLDATLRHATSAAPTFSIYDRDGKRVLERTDLGGCEPYFSHDGRWGFWVPGAGGPIDRIDLATRKTSTILRKNDPRLGEKGYLYFPMLSRDGRLLAFGASDDDHSHFEADYDVFVVPTDPRTLEVVGPPVRITSDPATDRYPDLFLARASAALEAALDRAAPTPEAAGTPPLEGEAWPVRRDALVFLWQTGASPNLVDVAAPGGASEAVARRAYGLEPEGRARLDHFYRMVLDEGAFVAPAEAAQSLLDAATATNELTVEATLIPSGPAGSPTGVGEEMGRIVTVSSGPGKRSFTLGQEGERLVARVRTGQTGDNADRPQVPLFEVEPGVPVHVVVTYTPGRLRAYRDGEAVVESDAIRGSFSSHWRFRQLLFGREWRDGGDWKGTLEGVAIYSRALSAEEARASAERYRRLREARPEVPRWRVRARLEARSEIPTLRQISPYRRALVVYSYRVVDGPDRPDRPREGPSGSVRVARWAILDGRTQPEASLAPGTEETLVLERYDDNRQLEDVYLSETLDEAPDGPLYYAVEREPGAR